MNKEAQTYYEIHPVLKKRWSPRAFSPQPVEKEKMQRIFEAARWSPSSMNEQPWRFIIGFQGDETYEKIFESLVEFNRLWAGSAPVLLVACGFTRHSKSGDYNETWQYDTGQSVAHLTFQCGAEGLSVHQMGGFERGVLVDAFHIPGDVEPVTVIAIGYTGDPGSLPENLKKTEIAVRSRKKFDEFVFTTEFGHQLNIL